MADRICLYSLEAKVIKISNVDCSLNLWRKIYIFKIYNRYKIYIIVFKKYFKILKLYEKTKRLKIINN